MNTQEMMAWSLVGLLVCNVLTLVGFGIAAMRMMRVADKIQKESGPAIQKAHEALAKLEALTQSAEKIVRDSITPTLSSVQETTHSVSQSAAGVRRMVGRVEDAVAKPIALVAAAGNALDTPAGKAGLLALSMGVAQFALRRNHQTKEAVAGGEPMSRRASNGHPRHDNNSAGRR